MNESRIGVYICWCGSNIAKMVDVEALSKEFSKLPNVVVSRDYKYMCSDPGQDMLIKDVKEHHLNRVVIAACSPRMHELTFRKALENAGLNPYLFEMANIREQCAWVHEDRELATKKARDLILAAIERVVLHEPLAKREVTVEPATLVIGGGIAGLTAALEIADSGKKVFLVEKEKMLGGRLNSLDLTFPYLDSAQELISNKINKVKDHKEIELFLESEVDEVSGYVGNFNVKVKNNGKPVREVKVGNIVVATGLKTFDAEKIDAFGYKKFPQVYTSVQLETMLKDGLVFTENFRKIKNIVFINCVGSRNSKYHEYCSRVCCLYSLKQAIQVKSVFPEANVFVAYSDMRVFGKDCEEFYERACKLGIVFMMFDKSDPCKVRKASPENCVVVELNEKLSGESIEVLADMVILSVGLEAREDAKKVGHLVGISVDKDGFFIEKHPKLDPVATTTDGVFIAGTCQGPKDISDTVAQAKAAAARVLGTICKGTYEVEVITSVVNEEICAGCQTCVKVCPYSAVTYDPEKKVAVVNEVLCKGCGTCTAACPFGAITSRHFTRQQILKQIGGILAFKNKEARAS